MTDDHVHAWYEVESGSVQMVDFCHGQLAHFSQRCPTRDTSPNEDAACAVQFSTALGLLAVADGVGGAASGNRASATTIKTLLKTLLESLPERFKDSSGEQPDSLRHEILDGVEQANREILEWRSDAGSTLVAVEFHAGTIRVFHIGDSMAMLLSNRGRIKFATVGHAPVAMAVEIGMLDEQQGLLHDDRNLITNCLGSREMKIEIGPPVSMSARDTLVVASDGLFDNLATQEIADIVARGDLAVKTKQLADLVMSRMSGSSDDPNSPSKPDDLTIVCFRQGPTRLT